jgi:uncharacterized membrane protein
MTDKDSLFVIAAAYPDTDEAIADYEAVKALYHEVKTSHDFDAAVIAKNAEGKVEIVKKHEQPTRHGGAVGLGWGLAAGAVAALFPPVGIGAALAWGGGAGAAIGAVSGHVAGGMKREDLKQLGEVLDNGTAGLVVVYAYDMADQVAANVKAVNRFVSDAVDLSADQLAADVRAAEQGAVTSSAPPAPTTSS